MNKNDDTGKPLLLTGDRNVTEDEIQRLTTGESFKITSKEALMELARAARRTYDLFELEIRPLMTTERALRIKHLRQLLSWRALASATFDEWRDDARWSPPGNQLAGMVLTRLAAEILGEKEDDWCDRSQGN